MIVACGIGEVGFVQYLHELRRLGVLSQDELLGWIALHGEVLRLVEPPLDTGGGVPDGLLALLIEDLGT